LEGAQDDTTDEAAPAGRLDEPSTLVESLAVESRELSTPPESVMAGDTAEKEQVELQEAAAPDLAQAVDQSSAAEAINLQAPDLGQVPETAQDHHQDPSSKSRWASWKEKIQGFIKKLFG
jgi:hypothetical protein